MPKLEYFLVSESLSVDQETNNVSVFSILEELSGPLPLAIPRLVAISSWNIEPDERDRDYQVALRIRLPSGEVMPESKDFKVNFTTTRMRHRIFQHVHGLRVNEAGELTLEVLLDGEHKASHTIAIHARQEEA
jgi:hypothetical protein